jgi:hypothetical protein
VVYVDVVRRYFDVSEDEMTGKSQEMTSMRRRRTGAGVVMTISRAASVLLVQRK